MLCGIGGDEVQVFSGNIDSREQADCRVWRESRNQRQGGSWTVQTKHPSLFLETRAVPICEFGSATSQLDRRGGCVNDDIRSRVPRS